LFESNLLKETAMPGHWGKITRVNLSTGKVEDLAVDEGMVRSLLGGVGIGSQLYLDRYDLAADALAPKNPLMFLAGPLNGTNLPGSGRFTVCARSPLTGIWGFGNCGGRFGPELKWTGRDGLIVEGKAAAPVYLYADDNEVRIEEARDLWGQTSWETEDRLKAKYAEGRKVQVCAIGPAGENRVRFAAIVHDRGDFIGRCGMGAVMGSKNLKAIVLRGARKVEPARPDEYKATLEQAREELKKAIVANSLKSFGTNVGLAFGLHTGDVPIKNWALGLDREAADTLGAKPYTEKYLTRGTACYACPIACKRQVAVKQGKYQTAEVPGPEYETVTNFGTMLLNHDLEAVIQANTLCNQLGLDTVSAGAGIAFAMDLWEHEIIGPQDTGGLELKWGNLEAALKLLPQIAAKQGLGELLAEGSERMAARLGPEAKAYLTTVKGLEAPGHDPRAYHGLGILYAMSPRGACHIKHLGVQLFSNLYPHASVGVPPKIKAQSSEDAARLAAIAEDLGAQADAAVICIFVQVSLKPETYLAMLRGTTGFDYDLEEMLAIGRRIWTLERGITNLQGVTAADDRLPPKLTTPPAEGPHAKSQIDLDLMKKEYYSIRGLDEQGRPSPERCRALGLENMAKKLSAL
jgi:aldehyde:ferredoxin oxidoreductase